MDKSIIYKWNFFYFKSDFKLFGLTALKAKPLKKVTANILHKIAGPVKNAKLISQKFHRYKVYNKRNNYYVIARYRSKDVDDFTTHHVLPMILTNKNELVMHAASLSKNGKCILISGVSGSGKSTLSQKMKRSGWTPSGDESQVLTADKKTWHSQSLARTLRLHSANKKSKILRILKPKNGKDINLLAILVLKKSNKKSAIISLTNDKERFHLLIQNCFLHQNLDQTTRRIIFGKLYRVYCEIPVYLIQYPHNSESLHAIKKFTENLLIPH